jgi:uncharacterized protein (UPF0332 family)
MTNNKNEKVIQDRLKQARESLEEAKALLVQDAEAKFVMNSLYYAFLHPILGLLQSRGLTAPMQSTSISLFDAEFVQKGDIELRFLVAARKAFDLRPACDCEGKKKVTPDDIEQLLPIAEEFLQSVERTIV